MDPMTMAQGMYGGFAGQDFSGMNGINTGMGFPNGQGAYGGYNGQPGAWNAGQDAFNQNAYGTMSGGFGAQSGYSDYSMSPQGNFNNVHQQQYPNNDYNSGHNGYAYQGRGRGRGRGYYNAGRGRGAFNQSHTGFNTKYQQYQEQMPNQYPQPSASLNGDNAQDENTVQAQSISQDDVETSQSADTQGTDLKDMREVGKTPDEPAEPTQNASVSIPAESEGMGGPEKAKEEDQGHITESSKQNTQEGTANNNPDEEIGSLKVEPANPSIQGVGASGTSVMPPPPAAVSSTNPVKLGTEPPFTQNFTFRGRGRGYPRGGFDPRGGMRGRGSAHLVGGIVGQISPAQSHANNQKPVIPLEPKGLGVVGAPTGPKALREGTSAAGLRGGRGFSIVGRASAAAHVHQAGREPSRR